jgi:hypothetical protein
MPHAFDDTVMAAVLRHMNSDHTDDNLLIVRAHGRPDAVGAAMTGFDGDGGEWDVTGPDGAVTTLRVPWPHGPISERGEVRREVVALYDAACSALGVTPRPH